MMNGNYPVIMRVHQGLASGDDIPLEGTNSWGAEYYEGDRTRIMNESIQLPHG
jgi:hypothetical protein